MAGFFLRGMKKAQNVRMKICPEVNSTCCTI